VLIHELGHYLMARIFHVRVKELMIGMPGPSLSFTHKNIRYGITAIPLGGYTAIAGMEPGAEDPHLGDALQYLSYWGTLNLGQVQKSNDALGFDLESTLDILDGWGTIKRTRERGGYYKYEMLASDTHAQGEPRYIPDIKAYLDQERTHTYRVLPWWKRLVVLFAGPAFNLIFAIVFLSAVFMAVGTTTATTTVASVVDGSPAAQAGIVAGDTLLSLDGTSIGSWDGFLAAVQEHAPGDSVDIAYEHNGTTVDKTVALEASTANPQQGMLGVESQTQHTAISPVDAVGETFSYIGATIVAVAQLLDPATTAATVQQSTSLVGIAVMADQSAAQGPLTFFYLVALISVSLGIMNLLPIPPLDGGKIVVETIERIAHRHVPVKVIAGIQFVGIAAIVLLFVVVTGHDILNLMSGAI
jgi:regulator of sigma E protease